MTVRFDEGSYLLNHLSERTTSGRWWGGGGGRQLPWEARHPSPKALGVQLTSEFRQKHASQPTNQPTGAIFRCFPSLPAPEQEPHKEPSHKGRPHLPTAPLLHFLTPPTPATYKRTYTVRAKESEEVSGPRNRNFGLTTEAPHCGVFERCAFFFFHITTFCFQTSAPSLKCHSKGDGGCAGVRHPSWG